MSSRWQEMGEGFWNLRGSFRIGGVVDIGRWRKNRLTGVGKSSCVPSSVSFCAGKGRVSPVLPTQFCPVLCASSVRQMAADAAPRDEPTFRPTMHAGGKQSGQAV